MKKIVLLAVLALVLVAVPAFASVQNVKVSGDIDSTYVYRNQFDLGGGATGTAKQSFFMTQTQLRVDADLTDKVGATIRLINERAWTDESVSNTDADLNLAYVTVKEMLYSPLTVVVGRQAFAFGNSLVVDSEGNGPFGAGNRTIAQGGLAGVAGDLSKRRAMDAIRAILDYNPLTVDLVYAKINANGLTSAVADQKDDIDLMGINANYKLGDKYDTVLEGYFWAKVDRTNLETVTVNRNIKTNTVYVPGVRGQVNLLDGLLLSAEFAWQKGTYSTDADTASNRDARAAQLIANYALPLEELKAYSPTLMTSLTYLSGDKCNQSAGGCGATPAYGKRDTAWDPMFENQSRGKIYNTLFNYSNAWIASAKGSVKPIEDLTASVEYTALWLDKQATVAGVFRPDSAANAQFSTSNEFASKKLGDEIDLGLVYAYTEDVSIGASLGWFKPGDVFTSANDKAASQALVNLDVKF